MNSKETNMKNSDVATCGTKGALVWGKFEAFDCRAAECAVTINGELVATIVRYKGDRPGALSMTDTAGAVERYEATVFSTSELAADHEETFWVGKREARAVLRQARGWVAERLGFVRA